MDWDMAQHALSRNVHGLIALSEIYSFWMSTSPEEKNLKGLREILAKKNYAGSPEAENVLRQLSDCVESDETPIDVTRFSALVTQILQTRYRRSTTPLPSNGGGSFYDVGTRVSMISPYPLSDVDSRPVKLVGDERLHSRHNSPGRDSSPDRGLRRVSRSITPTNGDNWKDLEKKLDMLARKVTTSSLLHDSSRNNRMEAIHALLLDRDDELKEAIAIGHHLVSCVKDTNAVAEGKDDKIRRQNEKIGLLEGIVKELESENHSMRDSLKKKYSESTLNTENRMRLYEAEEETRRMRDLYEDSARRCSHLESSLTASREKLDLASTDLQLFADMETDRNTLQRDLRLAHSSLTKLKEENTAMNLKLASQSQEKVELETKFHQAVREIDNLRSTQADLRKQVVASQDIINEMREESSQPRSPEARGSISEEVRNAMLQLSPQAKRSLGMDVLQLSTGCQTTPSKEKDDEVERLRKKLNKTKEQRDKANGDVAFLVRMVDRDEVHDVNGLWNYFRLLNSQVEKLREKAVSAERLAMHEYVQAGQKNLVDAQRREKTLLDRLVRSFRSRVVSRILRETVQAWRRRSGPVQRTLSVRAHGMVLPNTENFRPLGKVAQVEDGNGRMALSPIPTTGSPQCVNKGPSTDPSSLKPIRSMR